MKIIIALAGVFVFVFVVGVLNGFSNESLPEVLLSVGGGFLLLGIAKVIELLETMSPKRYKRRSRRTKSEGLSSILRVTSAGLLISRYMLPIVLHRSCDYYPGVELFEFQGEAYVMLKQLRLNAAFEGSKLLLTYAAAEDSGV